MECFMKKSSGHIAWILAMWTAQPTCVLTSNTSFSAKVKGLKAWFQPAGKKGVQELASGTVGWHMELGPSAQTCQSFHCLIICVGLSKGRLSQPRTRSASARLGLQTLSQLPAKMTGVKKVKEDGDLREQHRPVLCFTETFPTSFQTGGQRQCRHFKASWPLKARMQHLGPLV